MAHSSPAKKARTDASSSEKIIGTHSGTFHADEALAVNLIRSLEEYEHASELSLLEILSEADSNACLRAELVRSRDLKVIEKCDIVVDVRLSLRVFAN
jgi:uncharacterized UPF0160 family protein